MNTYSKVGLQFAFPIYIWAIIALVIILCRHSGRLSSKIGYNVIQVLATLILLSYTKLIRTVVLIMKATILVCESGESRRVWFFDGSVEYLSTWQHILLFTLALLILATGIPFTAFLLMDSLIEKYLTRISCIGKKWLTFKPYFDAFNGSYKDKYRFWTGFLLLIRIALILLVSFDTSDAVITMCIIATVVVLLSFMVLLDGVYQKKSISMLECWALLSLVLISALRERYRDIGYIVGVTMMLASFVGVLIYSVFYQIKLKFCKRIAQKCVQKPLSVYADEESPVDVKSSEKVLATTSEVWVTREPLLFPAQ